MKGVIPDDRRRPMIDTTVEASVLFRPDRVIIPSELMTPRMAAAKNLGEMADAFVEIILDRAAAEAGVPRIDDLKSAPPGETPEAPRPNDDDEQEW